MILYERMHDGIDIEVCDGPNEQPGSFELYVGDGAACGPVVLSEREALTLANALTRGKLQALLDAIDHAGDTGAAIGRPIRDAREALR